MSRLLDPREHDDLLNYQLKRLVNLGGAPAIRLCEGAYGITRQEWRIIAALVEDGAMSPSALTARSGMESGRVSQIITRLVGKRLIARTEQAGDRRRASVRATEAGIRLYEALFPQLAAINRRLMAVLSPEEARSLEDCLRKLTEHALMIYEDRGGVEVQADRHVGGSQRFWR